MKATDYKLHFHDSDIAPGDQRGDQRGGKDGVWRGLTVYLIGLGLAVLLTALSFFVARTDLVWAPSIPVALATLAIAQMGVHLVFFIHITTGEDNVNNIMALAFGVLIVFLVIAGSLWIMDHLDHNMLPMKQIMQMQR